MKKILTDEQEAYMRRIAPGMHIADITEAINLRFGTDFSQSMIKWYKSRHEIHSGKVKYRLAGRVLTAEQEVYLRSIMAGRPNANLVMIMNWTFGLQLTVEQMKAWKANHHLNSGLTGHFPKGNIPANKGVRQPGKTSSTSFKKGNVPANHCPVGTEKITKDGYIAIKVAEHQKWKLKQRAVWEQHNGPIPEGRVVTFLNSDKTDCRLENLVLITKAENVRMNQNHLYSEHSDITKSGILVARVMASAFKRKRRKKEKE